MARHVLRARSTALALAIAIIALLAAGCVPHRPDRAAVPAPAASSPGVPGAETPGEAPAPSALYRAPIRIAFAAEARVLVENVESRKMKLRFYGQAPDRFRIEVRGPVGGVALVVTGRGGRLRAVFPSKRRYAEVSMEEDIASDLVGVPMSGCDLAMVARISAGFKKFHPCGGDDPNENAPVTAGDRPGLIVDTNTQGAELVRFGWDWSGDGPFPKEMRVESLTPPQSSLALTAFKSLDDPGNVGDDFFWEPAPAAAMLVPMSELAGGAAE